MKTFRSTVVSSLASASLVSSRTALSQLFLIVGFLIAQPCRSTPFEFEQTGSLATGRCLHTATLLPNGNVLVAGGEDRLYHPVANAELYNAASRKWTATGSLHTARSLYTATLLPKGNVPFAGGYKANVGYLARTELYDVGLGSSSAWQPDIHNLKINDGKRLLLSGSRFQGISQASGGNTQDSSSNYPIVQLRSIDNSEVSFLPIDLAEGWSDTSFSSLPVKHFPLGPALATVFTNGIPSTARYLIVEPCN